MFIHFLLCITSQLSLLGFTAAQGCDGIPANEPQVFITASSIASPNLFRPGKIERQLELNWFNVLPQDGDSVALYSTDPTIDKSNPLVKISPKDHPLNYYRSSYQLPRPDFKLPYVTNQCVGFWVAYLRNDQLLAQNCAKIHPRWMWESRNIIGNFTLAEIMIPGTHNSGSYDFYDGILSENVLVRYKYCQDEDLFNQFVYGIRAFDIRIGSYPKKSDEFWVNHEKIKMYPFRVLLQQIKHFINSTKEIVILDFHRFPVGFENDSTHDRFISYLMDELGDWLVPRDVTQDVTLSQLWEQDKRVVAMYSNSIHHNYELLWGGLSQKWANTMEVNGLKKHIAQFAHWPNRNLWAAMAQLTPTVWTVITKPTKGLRYYADKVNRDVTKWFRDEWWETGNIVNTDYFHGNDIVEVAIKANERRKRCEDKIKPILFDIDE